MGNHHSDGGAFVRAVREHKFCFFKLWCYSGSSRASCDIYVRHISAALHHGPWRQPQGLQVIRMMSRISEREHFVETTMRFMPPVACVSARSPFFLDSPCYQCLKA